TPVPPELRFALELDAERRARAQPPRGSFLGRGPAERDPRTAASLELPRQREQRCESRAFRLHDDIRDKLRPVTVTLSYGIGGARGARGGRGTALPPLIPAL
ncbi:ITA7 protein, partial [Copsychus sechellarum]|nr:ITA7 protein [Copsychus sechellarum]